jgi:SAM-dependent methyltransferase
MVIFQRFLKGNQSVVERLKIKKYLASGSRPWTLGYNEYKGMVLRHVLIDKEVLDCFLHNRALPIRYGLRLDERLVEYPWVLARLDVAERLLLDAGSTLNFSYILDLPALKCRSVVIYNLSPEDVVRRDKVSYIYGDLRHTILKDECFDEIVCISTLEHVGMDNTFLYSKDLRFKECIRDDYRDVVTEFKRLLKPRGKLYITVPYGRYENHGWLQQFDKKMVATVVDVFGGSASTIAYYKYSDDGWQVGDADACDECSYFDIHHRSGYEPDYVAAARAVACIEMAK